MGGYGKVNSIQTLAMLSPLLIKSKSPCQMQARGDDDIVLVMRTKKENLIGNCGMDTNLFNQNQRS